MFSRVILDNNPPLTALYKCDKIGYTPIPFTKNLKLGGHYQSFKYFHHNRGWMRALFYPTEAIRDHIMSKYGPVMADITAIQVRRGDYYKFPDHHPLLTPDYYAKAVKLADPKEFRTAHRPINSMAVNKPAPQYPSQLTDKHQHRGKTLKATAP